MNRENEYCLRTRLTKGNASPTKKFPDQLATLIADIIIGLGPTSDSSIKQFENVRRTFAYLRFKLKSFVHARRYSPDPIKNGIGPSPNP